MFGKHGGANIAWLPVNLPNVLARVIDSDSDTDNKCCAMNCLLNLAAKSPSFVLVDNEALACALRVVRQQGTGALAPAHACTTLNPCSFHSIYQCFCFHQTIAWLLPFIFEFILKLFFVQTCQPGARVQNLEWRS